MKSYKIGIILLFLLVFSIGTVCAEDVDNTTLSSTDGDVMSTGEKTYDDLSNLINSSSSSTIDIKYDYKFNTITDTQKTIIINESSLHYVIEGNDHVIDGSGSAGLFTIVNSKVTLKNIVIKNCNSTAIIALNSTLETINVTFEKNNNSNVAGAVYAKESTFISNGSGKTNSKGIVQITIKKADLNKLKAGKTYTVSITYSKDTIKTSLKVKR